MGNDFYNDMNKILQEISESKKIDVYFFAGPIYQPYDNQFAQSCKEPKNKNAMLMIATRGGDSNVAYRIARQLQRCYESYTIFICDICKSAGTLITLGAREIIMADNAEIGPLDVQLQKPDEPGERSSGLEISNTISRLQTHAFEMFEDYFYRLRYRTNFQITTKSATEIAAKITVGLFEPIYAQLDPMRLGEIDRAIRVAFEYGNRIKTDNLKTDTIGKLISEYPDHSFVIDFKEASELFNKVRKPDKIEAELAEKIKFAVEEHLKNSKTIAINLTKTYIDINDKQGGVKDATSNGQNDGAGGQDQAAEGQTNCATDQKNVNAIAAINDETDKPGVLLRAK